MSRKYATILGDFRRQPHPAFTDEVIRDIELDDVTKPDAHPVREQRFIVTGTLPVHGEPIRRGRSGLIVKRLSTGREGTVTDAPL
jgi:hypothetical protein